MSRPNAGLTFTVANVLAWSTFIAITLALAFIVQVLAVSAPSGPTSVAPPNACLTPFPAQAALLQGDDVLARYLTDLCTIPTPEVPGS